MLDAVGVKELRSDGETRQLTPYNLLATQAWMLLVPRSRECVEGLSVNALGFAGSLFVRSEAQLRLVEARGPLEILRQVGVAKAPLTPPPDLPPVAARGAG